jgi:hypothetical protein
MALIVPMAAWAIGIRPGHLGNEPDRLGCSARRLPSTRAAERLRSPTPPETAREMVTILREKEKVDVIICLSHGGLQAGKDGRFTEGEDVNLAKAVPGHRCRHQRAQSY